MEYSLIKGYNGVSGNNPERSLALAKSEQPPALLQPAFGLFQPARAAQSFVVVFCGLGFRV